MRPCRQYDGAGVPVESVADYLIKPAPGAINPFLPGAERDASARTYSLAVADGVPPADQPVGMNQVGQQRATLHAPKYGAASMRVTRGQTRPAAPGCRSQC